MRKASIVALVLGVALVVAGGIVRWVVAPNIVKLPGDTDTTRTYAGTATTLLNPAAVATGATSQALLRNVPIVATHHTKVLQSNSGSSEIADTHTLSAAGNQLSTSTFNYAVDRKDMDRGSGFSNVTKQTGLTFNFPIHTGSQNYTGWISDTGTTTVLRYVGTANRGGSHVKVFETSVAATPLTDPHQLQALPGSLPKTALPGLATAVGISPAQIAAVTPLLRQLPASIPLSYTYQLSATYYVAPASGIVVDLTQHEIRSVGLAGGALPAFPIADISFTSTPASLAAAVNDAKDKGNRIDLYETTLPWSLGIPGIVLVLAGLVMLVISSRRPRVITLDQPPAPAAPATVEMPDAGVPPQRKSATDQPTPTTDG